jgi:hypothetical protein
VLRDWAYFDFVGIPFINSPSHKLLLAEMLADDFEVVRLALVRHPIDQWLSMIKTFPVLESVPVELYLAGYWEYSQQIQSCGFVRYEDFTGDPVGQMEVICSRFQLEFDRDFMARWQEYDKITGDTDRTISRGAGLNKIVSLPRRPCEDSLLKRFRSNKIYGKALELLGYEDE